MFALTEAHREQFARDGYCVLKNFLSAPEVDATARAFERLAAGDAPTAEGGGGPAPRKVVELVT